MGSGSFKSVLALTDDQMKTVFDKWDVDKSGTVDDVEIGPLLEDLGLMAGTEAENAAVMETLFTTILPEADENGDGLISFAEFKKFVQLAAEEEKKKGKKGMFSNKKAAVVGKDSKALSTETENLRTETAARKAREKAEQAAKLAQENKRK